jgi:hypothetical protein
MANTKNFDNSMTINVPAAGAVSEGLLYGINASGQAVAADRATGPQRAVGFAITSLTAAQASNGNYVALVPTGIVECNTVDIAGGAFTIGGTVYLDTAGKYTTTKPTTAGNILQAVGVAMSASKVAVNIVPYGLTLQVSGSTTIAP